MNNIVEVSSAKPGQLPFTTNTLYKFHSLKRYPNVLFKVGNKLIFDVDEWNKEIEEARKRNVKKAKKLKLILDRESD